MADHDLLIGADGGISYVFDDELIDVFDGEPQTTRRVSTVEPADGGGWTADMSLAIEYASEQQKNEKSDDRVRQRRIDPSIPVEDEMERRRVSDLDQPQRREGLRAFLVAGAFMERASSVVRVVQRVAASALASLSLLRQSSVHQPDAFMARDAIRKHAGFGFERSQRRLQKQSGLRRTESASQIDERSSAGNAATAIERGNDFGIVEELQGRSTHSQGHRDAAAVDSHLKRVLGPYRTRAEALASERNWLRENFGL